MKTELLRFQQLRDHGVLLCRSTIWRLEQRKQFPAHVNLSERRVAWVRDEIEAWVQKKIDARSEKPTKGKSNAT